MATTTLTIKRSTTIALLEALGFKTAGRMKPDQLAKKLAGLPDLLKDDPEIEDEDADALATEITMALDESDEVNFKIDNDMAPETTPATKKKAGTKIAGVDVPEKAATKPVKKKVAPAAKPAKKEKVPPADKPAKKEKVAKPEQETTGTPDTAKAPGVRVAVTRPYMAGVIIGKHGLDAGITDAMVAELNAAYGKENDGESLFALRNAWHAARGFYDQNSKK